jgi:hypothetical protein
MMKKDKKKCNVVQRKKTCMGTGSTFESFQDSCQLFGRHYIRIKTAVIYDVGSVSATVNNKKIATIFFSHQSGYDVDPPTTTTKTTSTTESSCGGV